MSEQKVSSPFRYEGYTTRTHRSCTRHSTYIKMSDGAQIAADIYLPESYLGSGATPTRFPVIFVFSPYNRANLNPETGDVDPINFKTLFVFGGTHVPADPEDNVGFPHHGYACVVADTRGHGASIGTNPLSFGWRYQKDAGEVVDWIGQQDWCDGNVGMIGASHVAWTQLAAASCRPRALKAIMPAVVPLDAFTGQYYPGGIYMQGFIEGKSGTADASQANRRKWICAPVENEAVPENAGNFGNVLKGSFDYEAAPFIDTRATTGESARDLLANMLLPISQSGVAIYHLGAWFDAFVRGTCELFATLQPTNASRMAIYPGFHGLHSGFMYEHCGVSEPDTFTERRRFFDRYLRGIRNGIDTEPPVLIHVMNGEGWRQEAEWPLAREVRTTFFLSDDKGLKTQPEGAGTDKYDIRLDHDRRYGTNRSSRWSGLGGSTFPRGMPDMTEQDISSLTYTSSVLGEDVEVTGHPIARLFVACDADDADMFVFLEDVDPDGCPLLVTEGQLRAGFARLHDPDEITDTGIAIQPRLPWHGYRKADYHPDIFSGGTTVELVIDLLPTSWIFRAGHAIRLSVACANWPDFALNPVLSPQNDPGAPSNRLASIYLKRGLPHPSALDLPIIPRT